MCVSMDEIVSSVKHLTQISIERSGNMDLFLIERYLDHFIY